jgi:ABC-type tungstate transport system permease subunit
MSPMQQTPAPAETYDYYDPDKNHPPSGTDIRLRIGNGGAGQSGLVKLLAQAFIKAQMAKGDKQFRVEWYKSDTTITLGYLQRDLVDVGLTYNTAAEEYAITSGYADRATYGYAFCDHFCVVGPTLDPAGLKNVKDARVAFQKLYEAGESGKTPATRFLSRFDKSATNIKESSLWTSIGQVPWAIPYSTWYHAYIDFPLQALETAALLGEYTLTDRGTWLSVSDKVRAALTMFLEGRDDDPRDLLLNPCHALASTKAASNPQNKAKEFIDFIVSPHGQELIAGFRHGDGPLLYSKAPPRVQVPNSGPVKSPLFSFDISKVKENRTDAPYVCGALFRVGATDITITELGVEDNPSNGSGFANGSAQVGLWDATGATLLASATVLSADPLGEDGVYRYHALSAPVVLRANTSYLIGSVGGRGFEPFGDSFSGPPLVRSAGVSLLETRYTPSDKLTAPLIHDVAGTMGRYGPANALFC